MAHIYRNPCAVTAAFILFAAASVWADEPPPSAYVTAYPASFFGESQPSSAFDMLALLPGYTFIDTDDDIRGLAGGTSNVLIDGARAAGKSEPLETILRRIPASAVSRIELLRPGAQGVDMQGHTLLANVVRMRRAQMRGSAEMAAQFYERGMDAPRIAGEFSHRSDVRMFELAAAHFKEIYDDNGVGHQPRVAPNGALIRDTNLVQDDGERIAELSTGYAQELAGGKLRVNGSFKQENFRGETREEQTFPEPASATALEFGRRTLSELGAQYERPVGERLQLDLIGINRETREKSGERESDAADSSLFRASSQARESILRGVLRRVSDAWTLEGGVEGALNILDSHNELQENGVDVALPAASVRVEERRGEAFATATWRMSARWTFEAGSRFESSELTQSGDSNVSKSFFFAKPRALMAFAPAPAQRWRLLIERRVGQLDFEDFVSSTSLSSDTITAGNPDLEPDRTWLTELSWERDLPAGGSLVLTGRREFIAELIDRVPVGDTDPLDGVGNIGDGEREELELNVSVPLRQFAGLLKATALWRSSRATDPTTGQQRPISEDQPFEAALHFTQDLSQWSARWGVDVEFERESREFMIDEVRIERYGTKVNVFAEHEPAPRWKLRMFIANLTDRPAERERWIYDGLRGSGPLSYIETRSLKIGPYAGISVRRTFGE